MLPSAVVNEFIERTIELAARNVRQNGGPFAALVVKNGKVIATGVNRVTGANDPTAHAEIVAIREACRALGDFRLTQCDVYSSCEPCPMCLGALYWARPAHIFFAATSHDAAAAGFDDAYIHEQMETPSGRRAIPTIRLAAPGALRPFEEWLNQPDKAKY